MHGNRSESGVATEGNYVMYIDDEGQRHMIRDGTVASHGLLLYKHKLHGKLILGGGYGKINKQKSTVTLGSYMPTYYHEPRIITAAVMKNALDSIIPGIKVQMAHDGLQDMNRPYFDSGGEEVWKDDKPTLWLDD